MFHCFFTRDKGPQDSVKPWARGNGVISGGRAQRSVSKMVRTAYYVCLVIIMAVGAQANQQMDIAPDDRPVSIKLPEEANVG
jgi:hypothetical protein